MHRTILTLVQDGILHEVHGRRAISFGLAQDPHAHLICTACGAVTDAPDPQPQTDWANTGAFTIDLNTIVGQGRCGRCAEQGAAAS